MKKYFISAAVVALVGLTVSFTSSIEANRTFENQVIELLKCEFGQCQATAKSTKHRCKHCVSKEGDMYCYQHD